MFYFALNKVMLKVMKKTRKGLSPKSGDCCQGRLSPLRQYMRDERYSIALLADSMGMSRSSVNRWMKVDDVRVSSLYDAARAMGGHVEWRIVKD